MTPLDIALMYRAQGLSVIPIPRAGGQYNGKGAGDRVG
jgi:hypothetical protein